MTGVLSTTDLDDASLVHKAAHVPEHRRPRPGQRGRAAKSRSPGREGFSSRSPRSCCRPSRTTHHVVALDFGMKWNILRCLVQVGCEVTVVPGTATAERVLALQARWHLSLQRPRRPGTARLRHRHDSQPRRQEAALRHLPGPSTSGPGAGGEDVQAEVRPSTGAPRLRSRHFGSRVRTRRQRPGPQSPISPSWRARELFFSLRSPSMDAANHRWLVQTHSRARRRQRQAAPDRTLTVPLCGLPRDAAAASYRTAATSSQLSSTLRQGVGHLTELPLWVIRVECGPRASAAHVRCSPKATTSHQHASVVKGHNENSVLSPREVPPCEAPQHLLRAAPHLAEIGFSAMPRW